jgi:hypothetical protein
MPSVSLFLKFFFSPEENAKHNITFREKLSMEKEKKTEKKKKTKLLTDKYTSKQNNDNNNNKNQVTHDGAHM